MSETSHLSFDLVTQPWLPVTLVEGGAETWGLSEFFRRAHEAKGLNEPSPLAYTATLRMLLAILHRAFDGPKTDAEWDERFLRESFDADEIDRYLARWQHRFDLYHPQRPFAQVDADEMMDDGTRSPLTRLMMERSSGNNAILFDHSQDDEPAALSPGDAARAVLTANQYAFAGSGGKFNEAPMVAGYSVTLEGQNIFQTLMLNLQRYDDANPETLNAESDAPWWEVENDPPVMKTGLRPRGLTDLLTWRSRKLRLLPESDGTVRWVNYAQRYVVLDQEYRLRDPFKSFRLKTSGEYKGYFRPQSFNADRALWRDIDSLIEKTGSLSTDEHGIGRPLIIDWLANISQTLERAGILSPSMVATGLIKDTQATVKLWRMDRLPLPVRILNDHDRIGQVCEAIQLARAVNRSLNQAGKAFVKSALTEVMKPKRQPLDSKDVEREEAALGVDARYWSNLEQRFQQFMTQLMQADNPETPLEDWTLELNTLVWDVFRDATQSAGSDARWLMAYVAGEEMLHKCLRKWVPEIYIIREARKEGVAKRDFVNGLS